MAASNFWSILFLLTTLIHNSIQVIQGYLTHFVFLDYIITYINKVWNKNNYIRNQNICEIFENRFHKHHLSKYQKILTGYFLLIYFRFGVLNAEATSKETAVIHFTLAIFPLSNVQMSTIIPLLCATKSLNTVSKKIFKSSNIA